MKSFFCLLLAFVLIHRCLPASVSSNEFAIPITSSSSDPSHSSVSDDEEVFMVCTPMRSRQQLITMLQQQSSEQLKASLIASDSTLNGSSFSPAADFMPGGSFADVNSPSPPSVFPAKEEDQEHEELIKSVAQDAQPRLVARAIKENEATENQLTNSERQGSIMNQLMGLLPTPVQKTITSSLNHTRFGLNGSSAKTSTSTTTVAPDDSVDFPKLNATQEVAQDNSIADQSMPDKPSSNSSELTELQSDFVSDVNASSTSEPINVTTTTEDPLYDQFFGRNGDQPSILDRIQDALRLGKQKQQEAQKTLQGSNGPVGQDYNGDDRYVSFTSTSTSTAKPKLTLAEKFAALNVLSSKKTTTTTTAAPKVLFPTSSKDADHSELIAAALKNKLVLLESLKEDKKKTHTKISTTTTTQTPELPHYPYYQYNSPSVYTTTGAPRYYQSGWSQPAYPSPIRYGPTGRTFFTSSAASFASRPSPPVHQYIAPVVPSNGYQRPVVRPPPQSSNAYAYPVYAAAPAAVPHY